MRRPKSRKRRGHLGSTKSEHTAAYAAASKVADEWLNQAASSLQWGRCGPAFDSLVVAAAKVGRATAEGYASKLPVQQRAKLYAESLRERLDELSTRFLRRCVRT